MATGGLFEGLLFGGEDEPKGVRWGYAQDLASRIGDGAQEHLSALARTAIQVMGLASSMFVRKSGKPAG